MASVSPIKFYPKRSLTASQTDRIKSHAPSIGIARGEIVTMSADIVTPNGDLKTVMYKKVSPAASEARVPFTDCGDLFNDLKYMNVILTNACNLSCSYCYEQHSKDYGRFTPDSLRTVYDFLLSNNTNDGKRFQFFGGEPLIHKKLILDFLAEHSDHLQKNSYLQTVGMITNGVLLTPEFIRDYFQYQFVNMTISLDTDDATIDHREIGQEKIDHIFRMIELIPDYYKSSNMVGIRCTISVENAHAITSFSDRLYKAGIRTMVVHPLTMSSVDGFVSWPQEKWAKLRNDIKALLTKYPRFNIHFSEGVGVKGGGNCMVGSDMIAVDGSGDYSGCYFFTNQKEAAAHTILGNILDGVAYLDRYTNFQVAYDKMFEEEEQCRTCDLQGFCYQCPAGNADSGTGKLFRPDDMCQSIVKLFLDLQNDTTTKMFHTKYAEIVEAVGRQGEQFIFTKALTILAHHATHGWHMPSDEAEACARQLEGSYTQVLHSLCDAIGIERTNSISLAYERLMVSRGRPVKQVNHDQSTTVEHRCFYLTMLHFVLLNKKGDTLDNKPRKYILG